LTGFGGSSRMLRQARWKRQAFGACGVVIATFETQYRSDGKVGCAKSQTRFVGPLGAGDSVG
jgi:hypothetical protein